ncbi:endonuclease/exonuclease/phosphatase family protein [Actinoplanes sp. NPDC051851]|uniref:endonuclease/exonuclease/phosphatase family protein n=1 Tax=Actinoplanes sp. NPDC051851 TaxID=3154753 RepID=UPI00341D30A3
MRLRLMTWNIKTGGVDRRERIRLPAIAQVISAARPDLLCLQELRDFDRSGGRRMRDLAHAAGMVPHLARSVFGQPVAVLVRPPLRMDRTASVTWRLHHAAAVALIGLGGGAHLTVVSTHLNPFSPDRRRREARFLALRYASTTARVVLAGDLNGLHPADDHEAALDGLDAAYRRRHLGPDGAVDSRALAAFAGAGFTDLWRVAGDGDPRTVPTSRGGGAEFGGMRLDYVLASPPVAAAAREMRVIRGGATEHASDHYPVRVDLDL